jgi:hypothetical protein
MPINFEMFGLIVKYMICASFIALLLSTPSGIGPIIEHHISTSNLQNKKVSHVQLESAQYFNSQLE